MLSSESVFVVRMCCLLKVSVFCVSLTNKANLCAAGEYGIVCYHRRKTVIANDHNACFARQNAKQSLNCLADDFV